MCTVVYLSQGFSFEGMAVTVYRYLDYVNGFQTVFESCLGNTIVRAMGTGRDVRKTCLETLKIIIAY